MKVKLIYPTIKCGLPHIAEATVEARLTPKQIVVEWDKHPQIAYVNGHTSGPTGVGEPRFWRHNGACIGGHPMNRTWQLADGEMERVNRKASKGGG